MIGSPNELRAQNIHFEEKAYVINLCSLLACGMESFAVKIIQNHNIKMVLSIKSARNTPKMKMILCLTAFCTYRQEDDAKETA